MRRASAWTLDPCPKHCAGDEHGDRSVRRQSTKWSARAEKQRIGVSQRPTALHVRCDCLAYLLSQGQSRLTSALAADVNPCPLPVNVLQMHPHDVACPQPQASEQKQDGPVALTHRRGH